MSIPRRAIQLPQNKVAEEDPNTPLVDLISKKQMQPIKTASAQHHSLVLFGKNFLPILLNPTDDLSMTRREAVTVKGKVLVQAINKKLIKNDEIIFNQGNELILFEDYAKAHIPTRIEFQIFLGILSLVQRFEGSGVRFKNWAEALAHLGLEPNHRNYSLLQRTIDTFFGLIITFFDTTCLVRMHKTDAWEWKKYQSFVFTGVGVSKDRFGRPKSVYVDLSKDFLDMCVEDGFVQRLDVTKIMQFTSPKALSLYLYLLRWCRRIKIRQSSLVVYEREQPEPLSFLYEYLGWPQPEPFLVDGTPNSEAQPARIKRAIEKAIAEIVRIDPLFDFSLDEVLFKDELIKFNFNPL